MQNLFQAAPNWNPKAGSALVLGAGGAARAVLASLIEMGVPEIFLTNRTRERAERLKEDFGDRISVVDWVQAGNAMEGVKTVVNTTSLGMVGKPEMRVPFDALAPGMLVSDLVYTPMQTKLLRAATDAGATPVDGLGMLLHQAVPAFERWFGVRPEVDDELRAAVLR
jgi:shikimate dehydrogenase